MYARWQLTTAKTIAQSYTFIIVVMQYKNHKSSLILCNDFIKTKRHGPWKNDIQTKKKKRLFPHCIEIIVPEMTDVKYHLSYHANVHTHT